MENSYTNVSLFNQEQMLIEKRKETIEEIYLGKRMDCYRIIIDAYDKTMQAAENRNTENKWRNYFAGNMNWNVLDGIASAYGSDLGKDKTGRPYLRLSDNVVAYFKLLDHQNRPKNIPTGYVKEINTNEETLFGESDTFVYIGWKIRKNKYWDGGLSSVYMIEMKNQYSTKWVSDLSVLSSKMYQPKTVILPSQINLPDEIIITPKRNQNDEAVNQ